MMQVIEMTHSEKVEMYRMIEKNRLIEMLIEANNVINRLTEAKKFRIADVSGSLPYCLHDFIDIDQYWKRCKDCRTIMPIRK